jgi:hypothetical protein
MNSRKAMHSFPKSHDRYCDRSFIRLLVLLLALAVASPALLAGVGERDQDHDTDRPIALIPSWDRAIE